MRSIDELHDRLRVAARLLDAAATDIRDLGLAPARDNIRLVGEALASIFEVTQAIYAIRPDLAPALGPSESSEANVRLTRAFGRAIALADEGQTSAAIALLTEYVASEDSDLHRRIALGEIKQLRSQASDPQG